jgi:hypothetical protein
MGVQDQGPPGGFAEEESEKRKFTSVAISVEDAKYIDEIREKIFVLGLW